MTDKLAVRYQDEVLTLATYHSMFITITTGLLTLAHVEKIRETVTSFRRMTSGTKTCALTINRLSASQVQLDPAVRKGLVALMGETKEHSCAAALVFEGNSLTTMALRAALAVLLVASRSSVPTQTFADIEAGFNWVSVNIQPPPSAVERSHLRDAVLALYGQIKSAPAQRVILATTP